MVSPPGIVMFPAYTGAGVLATVLSKVLASVPARMLTRQLARVLTSVLVRVLAKVWIGCWVTRGSSSAPWAIILHQCSCTLVLFPFFYKPGES